jgi:2-polyprenyl-6-methoxyphenol hydroxylase-like FAD-dependent oxidoreductase
MTWDRGEGAGQAVEDAVVLSKLLSQDGDPAAALRGYEAKRIVPTKKITEQSLRLGKLQQSENPAQPILLVAWLSVLARLLGPRREQLMRKREAAGS